MKNTRSRQSVLRGLLIENLERRELMAGDLANLQGEGEVANALNSSVDLRPRLLSVAPNSGQILTITPAGNPALTTLNPQTESPTELVFRFDGAQQLDPATLTGIRILRAGGDGLFNGVGDTVITPGFLGFGENQRIVIARFSSPLPDDLYKIEILAEDRNGLPALRNVSGDALQPRVAGTDRDTYYFNVELGVQVASVVPQPTTSNAAGVVSRSANLIEIDFAANNDKLALNAVSTDMATRQLFQLILTQDTVSPNDDVIILPTEVRYQPSINRVGLVFASPIESFAGGAGTFRLRVGAQKAAPSAAQPAVPVIYDLTENNAGENTSNANTSIGTISGNYSAIIRQEIRAVDAADQVQTDYPGSETNPGDRIIQDESHIAPGIGPDVNPQITKRFYSFVENVPYGNDSLGRPVISAISEIQKQRIREVFEFYSHYLGIDFAETTGITAPDGTPALQVVVGDLLGPVLGTSGPGGYVSFVTKALNDNPGDANLSLGILDGSESWDNDFGFGTQADQISSQLMADARWAQYVVQLLSQPQDSNGPNFFVEAMRVVGSLLGLGQSNDLPPGTVQAFDPTLGRPANPIEQIFPGDHDIVHGQNLHRPDNRDIDLYRFEVAAGQKGTLTAETIAERLMNSSDLDTHLTLLREYTDSFGRLRTEIIAMNDDYFSQDSMIRLDLEAGVYYLAVTALGNQDFDPDVAGSGSGGTSQGRYELRVDFRPLAPDTQTLRDTAGTPIDGDGDGLAGGVFDFWFRAAAPAGIAAAGAPRTLYVSKLYSGSAQNGSLNQPYNTIAAAIAASRPGDIVRIVGNGGADANFATVGDNRAYEVGTGGQVIGTLSDGGNLVVPAGVTLMIDAGAIIKFGNSRILVGSNDTTTDRSGAAVQVLGTPQNRVIFTSYTDETVGIDTNPLSTTAAKGDWGGIEIRNDFDNSQGRLNRERQGAFLNYIANADLRYGGGQVAVGGTPKVVNPIDLSEARATIINNRISNAADAAISADPNTFEETLFTEPRYQRNIPFTPDYTRVGPVIRGNELTNNTINGLFIRVDTLAGQDPKELTVTGHIDETDITIVMGENLLVRGTTGGAVAETAGPSVALVVLTDVAPTAPGTGMAQAGAYRYLVTFVDAFGSESLPSAVVGPLTVAAGRAIQLTNLPTAPGDYVGRKLYRVRDNGVYELVAELNRQQTTYIDQGGRLPGSVLTGGIPYIQRARRDATLVVDPGVVLKSQGSRIEVGFGATMIAEGTDAKPIIFTSTRDDRYGGGSTFDTNGDGIVVGAAGPGDWSGILARHMSNLSLDSVVVTFGGGSSRVPGGFASFNAIEIQQAEARIANSTIENNASGAGDPGTTRRAARGVNDAAAIFVLGSQPIIINNVIRNNAGVESNLLSLVSQNGETAAISIDPNSMKAVAKTDYGRSIGYSQATTFDSGNLGPLVAGNRLGGNAINGMRVRGGTMTTEGVWDDTDIVHVVQKEIVVPDYHVNGGLRLQSSVGESLVVKLFGDEAGFTATGRPLDITDRIGGALHIVGTPGFPVVLTSLRDDTIGAGFDFAGRSMLDTNGDGSTTGAAPGDWRSVRLDAFTNDRNVQVTYEYESRNPGEIGFNNVVANAQEIGSLAPNLNAGDENLRLGITVTGSIAAESDRDIYKFTGTAGTMVWFDIDKTSNDLDSVIELIDAQGRIIAQSNNSLQESITKNVWFDPALVDNGQVFPLDQSAFSLTNANVNTKNDFQSTNPLDAGFRMVLPGTPGTSNDYFVRVRSSNLSPGDATTKLQDLGLINQGLTTGSYRMQIRLRQEDEVGGSTVRYATAKFATTAIEVIGGPMHSPLLGEFSESNPNEVATDTGSAINLGNILSQDRGAASIAGQIASANDVDWFRFTVQRQLSSALESEYHTSVVFDLDYADGLGRANTNLWVFQSNNGVPGNIVLIGRDSDIIDDVAAPGRGADTGDLSRGSLGSGDPFIGAAELPAGEYMVAVTNNSLTSAVMLQYQQNQITGEGNPLVRLEPLDSVQRLIEDRFFPGVSGNPTLPKQVGFDSAEANSVPFNLSDVNLYVSRDRANSNNQSQLLYGNAMTGAKEAQGSNEFGGIFTQSRVTDIAGSPNGRIVGPNVLPGGGFFGIINDNNTHGFTTVLTSGGASIATNTGIQTYIARFNPQNGNPEVIRGIAPGDNAPNGVGLDYTAVTYAQAADQSLALLAVATRANRVDFDRPRIEIVNGSPGFLPFDPDRGPDEIYIWDAEQNENSPLYHGAYKNILYRLDPDTQAGISPPAYGNRQGLATASGTGTQVREYGVFAEVSVYSRNSLAGDDDVIVVTREADGDIVGITQMGDFIYGVTASGELWRMRTVSWDGGFLGAELIATNLPNGLTSLTHGPRDIPVDGATQQTILQIPERTTSGQFRLQVLGSTTNFLQYNATAAQVQAELQALPGIGAGNIRVTGGPLGTGALAITFTGALAGSVIPISVVQQSFQAASAPPVLNALPFQANAFDLYVNTADTGTVTLRVGTDTVSFPGNGPEFGSAALLQAAINGLDPLADTAAQAIVTQLTNGVFRVVFNGAGAGGLQLAVDSGPASVATAQVLTIATPAQPSVIVLTSGGVSRAVTLPANATEASIATTINAVLAGAPAIAAGAVVNAVGAGQFRINFVGAAAITVSPATAFALGITDPSQASTIRLTSGATNVNVNLPANATLAQVQTEITNALNGAGIAATLVSITNPSPGLFNVVFTGAAVTVTSPALSNSTSVAIQVPVFTAGEANAASSFRLAIPPVTTSGTFRLQIGAEQTAPLNIATLSAVAIQNALRNLPSIAALGLDNIQILVQQDGTITRQFTITIAGPRADNVGPVTITDINVATTPVSLPGTLPVQQLGNYDDVLFGVTPNGTIHAFDVNGAAARIFPGGQSSTITADATNGLSNGAAGGTDVSGIDFSALDVNLWHTSDTRRGDAGHGEFDTFNRSRVPEADGGNSLRFGFRENSVPMRQQGDWGGIYNIATQIGAAGNNGNYNLAGGARGAMQSYPLDMSSYTAFDQPTLYFNYFINTEGSNSHGVDTAVMRDSFRVYALGPNGNWILLATNNSSGNTDNDFDQLINLHEFDNPVSRYVDQYGRSYRPQEIFDEGGRSGDWRQARINLAPVAGMADTVLRFEFGTGGDFRTGDPDRGGIEIMAKEGSRFQPGDNFSLNVQGVGTRRFQFITGNEPLLPGATPIPVNGNMTAVQVRDAIRLALARGINGDDNVMAYPVYGNTVVAFKSTVVNAGPLKITNAFDRTGDMFGPYTGLTLNTATGDWTATKNFDRAMQAGAANAFEGVYVDDIVVGFIERGEQVINPTVAGANAFVPTPFYEDIGGPNGARAEEVELGAYQLEIRQGREYGIQGVPGTGRITPFPGSVIDTNQRLSEQSAIVVSTTVDVQDGDTFTISDGVRIATFELDLNGNGVAAGNIRVPLTLPFLNAEARSGLVSAAIRDAIMGPVAQSVLKITAKVRGQVKNAFGQDIQQDTSNIVELFGPAASDLYGGRNFSNSPALQTVFYGDQQPLGGLSQGDSNITRDQGQLIIDSNTIVDSENYGITVSAGRQLRDDLGPNVQPRPYPGSVRNLVTLNNENLVPGPVLSNNVIARSLVGGIQISGDTGPGAPGEPSIPPRFVTRAINNTLYGNETATGTGISVDRATSPTLVNNIISNFVTGLSVTNGATAVTGANLYKGNTTDRNGIAAGTFEIVLGANEPLFANVNNDRFYLTGNSKAIDSSIASLQERPGLTQVKSGVQLPTSPLISPLFDVGGLRRVDDPLVNTPVGQGSNVFIDRGAVDRSDFVGPGVILTRPIDNDLELVDTDPNSTYVRLAPTTAPIDYFEVLIDERNGTGPDPETINENNVILTENGRILTPGVDYEFGYSVNSRTIRLTPLAGFWREGQVYEITINNRDRYALDVPSGDEVADGDQFTVVDSLGGSVVFEFDTGYQIQLPSSPSIIVPAGGGAPSAVKDADRFVITANGKTVTFELDNNLSTVVGSVAIPYLTTDTQAQLTQRLVTAIQGSTLGITAAVLSNGQIVLNNPTAIQIDTSASSFTQPAGTLAFVVPAPTSITDGQTFTVSDNQKTVTFEFDSDDVVATGNVAIKFATATTNIELATLIRTAINGADLAVNPVQSNALLNLGLPPTGAADIGTSALRIIGSAQRLLDGQTVAITEGGTTVRFEFDTNNTVAAGNVRVPFTLTQTPFEVAQAFATAISASALTFNAVALSDGAVSLGAKSTLTIGTGGATNIVVSGQPGVTSQSRFTVNTLPVDGQTFSITHNNQTLTFEFVNTTLNDGRNVALTPIFYSAGTTPAQAAAAIAATIKSSVLALDSTVTGNVIQFKDNPRTTYNVAGSPTITKSGIAGGVIVIPVVKDSSITAESLAITMRRALQEATAASNPNRVDTSLVARIIGGDKILLDKAVSVTGAINSLALPGIKDLAGNFLNPNRISGETQFTILMPGVVLDYGDAPDPFDTVSGQYPTLSGSGGASHVVFDGGVKLGTGVSSEPEAKQSANGLGDDFDDGVKFNNTASFPVGFESSGLISRQLTNTFTVTVSGASFVDGWIDFNGDGDWNDQGEQILNNQAFYSDSLTQTFTITLPTNLPIFTNPQLAFARFRVSTDGSTLPTGLATSGEVEDYRLTIIPDGVPPVLTTPIPDSSTNEDTVLRIPLTPNHFNDPDAWDKLRFTATSSDPTKATVAIDGNDLVITPVSNKNGNVTISVTATDLTNSSVSDTFVLNIVPVNDAPVAAADTYTVAVNRFINTTDKLGTVTQALNDNGVLANDTDADNDALTAVLVTGPTKGVLTLRPDGTFNYRPNAGAVVGGTDTFTYRAVDPSNATSAVTTVTITFTATAVSPHYNQSTPTDVEPGTNPGITSSLDALSIINLLNANRGRTSIPVDELTYTPAPYRDVNNDFFISSLDILAVVNYLNARSRGLVSEGESSSPSVAASTGSIIAAPSVASSSGLGASVVDADNSIIVTSDVPALSASDAKKSSGAATTLDSALADFDADEEEFAFASAGVDESAFDAAMIDFADVTTKKK